MPVNPRPASVPDVPVADPRSGKPPLPAEGAQRQRWLWQGRFGTILIEVVGDAVFVNGQQVRRHAA